MIAGSAGGRRLVVPSGRTTRPTSDRAREGFFATVGSLLGALDGLRVLDLYAGSGAVGLEAASRGAGHVLLVESDRAAVRAIRRNIDDLELSGVEVVADRAERSLPRGTARPYDLVFADPPYAVTGEDVARMLDALRTHGWLAGDALVAVERDIRAAGVPWPEGYVDDRARRYGDTALWYGRAA